MPYLNASIPEIECLLRKEYLYNFERGHGEFIDCLVFGASSIQGRALGFHALTRFGGQFGRLPLSAFAWKKSAPNLPLEWLQIWDCFSYDFSVVEYDWLQGQRCSTFLKDGKWYDGQYLMTIDWCGSPTAERARDTGWKCAHLLRLDNGCFAAQPNNRTRWYDASFITEPFPEKPDFKTMGREFKCEDGQRWATEDSDRFFYRYQEHTKAQEELLKLYDKARLGCLHKWVFIDSGDPYRWRCDHCGKIRTAPDLYPAHEPIPGTRHRASTATPPPDRNPPPASEGSPGHDGSSP